MLSKIALNISLKLTFIFTNETTYLASFSKVREIKAQIPLKPAPVAKRNLHHIQPAAHHLPYTRHHKTSIFYLHISVRPLSQKRKKYTPIWKIRALSTLLIFVNIYRMDITNYTCLLIAPAFKPGMDG